MDPIEKHLAPKEQPVFLLDAKDAFSKLSLEEKKYAHHISQACWHGSKTCLFQTSEESPAIFEMFQKLFHSSSLDELEKAAASNGVTAEEFKNFIQYSASFYGNLGNYLSFGDTKIIPRNSAESFESIIKSTKENEHKKDIIRLFESIKAPMYSSDSKVLRLGLEEEGISTYYSNNITKADIKRVGVFMQQKNISPYNTRLWKHNDKSFEIKIASSTKKPNESHTFEDIEIIISYGDHSPYMKEIVNHLGEALKYASNDNQKNMIEKYILHFNHGNIEDHKASQRYWIKDIGPVVETNIGFIESYRDPQGERGEFEGFVAMVNKETSLKFQNLVNNAQVFLKELPWGSNFEKDKFLRPDFTSLEVLSFASSGVPAGINIPNYDDIRQTEGFKNVSLGNVLSAKSSEPADYVTKEDQPLYDKLESIAFEVQVGIHELLGHGSGKLFIQSKNGEFNFDTNILSPITNQKISKWYKEGETWDNKFQSWASTMEECRAESVGIYLCLNKDLLKLFGHGDEQEANDIYYINWLIMVRAGLRALEFYTPEVKKWGQAHMQARFAILRVLLEAGNGLVTINNTNDDLTISINREKITTVGKKAIGEFLLKLQTYKSTGDVEGGVNFYSGYSNVPDEFLPIRNAVLMKKKPRRVFVQPHTFIDSNGQVSYQDFEATPQGLIKSFVTRFGPNL